MNKFMTAATAAFFAMTGAAHAATLTINGGTTGVIPEVGQTNEIVEDMYGSGTLGGFFGSSISIDSNSDIRITFLGFEAGFSNTFTSAGGFFNTETYAPDNVVLPSDLAVLPRYVENALAGFLNFTFSTDGGGSVPAGSVNNTDHTNSNNNTTGAPNFFATFGDGTTTSGNRLWLFFDDGGAGDDDNHDDLAIMIEVVPLPGAAIPLLTAMAGLGWIGRRRRNAAKV